MSTSSFKPDELDVRQRIISVTVELINNGNGEAAGDITIRKVATAADVNIAAVNYYFGSKDNLIYEALQKMFSPAKEVGDILRNSSMPAIDRLRLFLISVASQVRASPGPLKYFISHNQFLAGQQDIMQYIVGNILPSLVKVLAELTATNDQKRLTFSALQLVSSIVFPTMIFSSEKIDLLELPPIEEQVDILLERFTDHSRRQ